MSNVSMQTMPTLRTTAQGLSRAPGTSGEFVQGFLGGGTPFHITCPIDLFVEASVKVSPSSHLEVIGIPATAQKMRRSIEQAVELLGLGNVKVEVSHHSPLQIGKGMASSTADILSVATAIANATGRPLSEKQLALIATSIESSDGIMYPGMAAVNQKNGNLRIGKSIHFPQVANLQCRHCNRILGMAESYRKVVSSPSDYRC